MPEPTVSSQPTNAPCPGCDAEDSCYTDGCQRPAMNPCRCIFTVPFCENVEDHQRRLVVQGCGA